MLLQYFCEKACLIFNMPRSAEQKDGTLMNQLYFFRFVQADENNLIWTVRWARETCFGNCEFEGKIIFAKFDVFSSQLFVFFLQGINLKIIINVKIVYYNTILYIFLLLKMFELIIQNIIFNHLFHKPNINIDSFYLILWFRNSFWFIFNFSFFRWNFIRIFFALYFNNLGVRQIRGNFKRRCYRGNWE